jgi:hypothetical protein
LFNRLFYGAVVTAEDIQRQKSKIYGRKEWTKCKNKRRKYKFKRCS